MLKTAKKEAEKLKKETEKAEAAADHWRQRNEETMKLAKQRVQMQQQLETDHALVVDGLEEHRGRAHQRRGHLARLVVGRRRRHRAPLAVVARRAARAVALSRLAAASTEDARLVVVRRAEWRTPP